MGSNREQADVAERQRRRRARVEAERSGTVPPAWAQLRRRPRRPSTTASTGRPSTPTTASTVPSTTASTARGPVSDWTRVRTIQAKIDRDLSLDRMSPGAAARATRDLSFAARETSMYVSIPEAAKAIERLGVIVVAALAKCVKSEPDRLAAWDMIAEAWTRADLDTDPF